MSYKNKSEEVASTDEGDWSTLQYYAIYIYVCVCVAV